MTTTSAGLAPLRKSHNIDKTPAATHGIFFIVVRHIDKMLTNTEDLEELAETCLATAKAIKEHLAAKGRPQMTFDQNGPPKFPDDAPPNIQFARLTLREAAQRLADLAAGPEELVGFYPYQIVSLVLMVAECC